MSLILIAIGIGGVTAAFLRGSYVLSQAENKSRAMSLASVKMEEYMTKSFSGLDMANPEEGEAEEGRFRWRATVSEEEEGAVPYKNIVIQVFYREDDVKARSIEKEVRLTNIVPYPYIHLPVKYVDGDEVSRYIPFNTYKTVANMPINFKVEKDLMIVYNVAIEIEDTSGLETLDTIYTQCFIDNKPILPESRTPIMTQPLISNVVGVQHVSAKEPHTLSLRWKKDTNKARIKLKEANIIVVATESN